MFANVRIPRFSQVEKRQIGPLGTFRSPFRGPSAVHPEFTRHGGWRAFRDGKGLALSCAK